MIELANARWWGTAADCVLELATAGCWGTASGFGLSAAGDEAGRFAEAGRFMAPRRDDEAGRFLAPRRDDEAGR